MSLWHDVSLRAPDGDDLYNFICEIPKWTRKKYEIATDEADNPIKQDSKKGKLREFKRGDLAFNYGCFPQTWEDPTHIHPGESSLTTEWCCSHTPRLHHHTKVLGRNTTLHTKTASNCHQPIGSDLITCLHFAFELGSQILQEPPPENHLHSLRFFRTEPNFNPNTTQLRHWIQR